MNKLKLNYGTDTFCLIAVKTYTVLCKPIFVLVQYTLRKSILSVWNKVIRKQLYVYLFYFKEKNEYNVSQYCMCVYATLTFPYSSFCADFVEWGEKHIL